MIHKIAARASARSTLWSLCQTATAIIPADKSARIIAASLGALVKCRKFMADRANASIIIGSRVWRVLCRSTTHLARLSRFITRCGCAQSWPQPDAEQVEQVVCIGFTWGSDADLRCLASRKYERHRPRQPEVLQHQPIALEGGFCASSNASDVQIGVVSNAATFGSRPSTPTI